jgi:tRNA U34 5-carboxymethylaminomethyl modifying enzyme MnmG/GidA
VVHADGDVAGVEQPGVGVEQEAGAVQGRGEGGGVEAALVALELRQVGEAVEREAVGGQGERVVERGVEAGEVLAGQAVDEVEVQAAQAGGPGPGCDAGDVGRILRAADGGEAS